MPNRILRARLRQSQRWNRCSVFARDLYIRLITLVDDFGRYEAHPTLLASEAYPWGDETGVQIAPDNIRNWLIDLNDNDLITLYTVDGKEYLQFTRWKERLRSENSQFPGVSAKCMSNDSQMTVICRSSDSQMLALKAKAKANVKAQSPKPKPSSKPIGKITLKFDVDDKMNPSFQAVKLANRIITNEDGWAYDNCKVDVNRLNTKSLQTVIEPIVSSRSQKEILKAWQNAVFIAHGAKVDNLARDATAYAVQCFKQQLQQKASP